MNDKGDSLSVIFGLAVLVLVAFLVITRGCSDGDRAARVLQDSGYTDITTGGYEFSCDDDQCTGFVATSPLGHRVKGAVGCGWLFKACTVRISEESSR